MQDHLAIASTTVRFRFPNGEERTVILEVGAPFLDQRNRWCCEVDLRGLEDEVTAMIGDDSLAALSSSLLFLRMRMEHYRKKGVRILYLKADEDFLLDAYFPPRLTHLSKSTG